MSWIDTEDPESKAALAAEGIELRIKPRIRDLGGFSVGRVLPAIERKTVGPFTFFDHIPAATLDAGQGMDVRPHPHIALATVTYLLEGEFIHRDSLGSLQTVRPGDINWMTAGRGIVHSERTDPEAMKRGGRRSHGIQLWVALPKEHEEVEPEFHHHDKDDLPRIENLDYTARVLVGRGWGRTSPVKTYSETFYIDVTAQSGAQVIIPDDYEERALFLLGGSIKIGNQSFEGAQMLVFSKDAPICVTAEAEARFVLLGGEPLDGPRFMWWNFVSSSQERIEKAKADWAEGRFPKVPGDEKDFIPLPKI